jgi:hypothetical protein
MDPWLTDPIITAAPPVQGPSAAVAPPPQPAPPPQAGPPVATPGPWDQDPIVKSAHKKQGLLKTLAQEAGSGVPIAGAWVPKSQETLQFEQQHPWYAGAARLAGGVGGTALGLAGLAAAGTGIPEALAGTGLGALGANAAFGAGLSAADTAARQYHDTGEVNPWNVALSGAVGGVAGAAAPAIGSAASKVVGGVANKIGSALGNKPQVGPVTGLGLDKAVNAVRASGLTDAQIAAKQAALGPEGMAGEYSPQLGGYTTGIANLPGEGRDTIVNAYEQRQAQAPQRIEDAITNAMGPRVNLVAQNAAREAAYRSGADPIWNAWRNASVFPTQEVKDLTGLLEDHGFFNDAKNMLDIEGQPWQQNFFTTGQRRAWPTTQAWSYAKQAIDGRINQNQPTFGNPGDPNKVRLYTGLKNRLLGIMSRNPSPTLDENGNPTTIGNLWQRARDASANHFAIDNAQNLGKGIFDSTTNPDEFEAEWHTLSAPEQQAAQQGARQSIADLMDKTARGDTAVRDKFRAPAAQQKLRTMIGDPAADQLTSAMEQEKLYRDQYNETIKNSQTAIRQQYAGQVTPPNKPGLVQRMAHFYNPHVTPMGFLEFTGLPEMEANSREAQYEQARAQLAKLLTAKGPQAANYVKALKNFRRPSETVAPQARKYARTLMQNLPIAIGSGGTQQSE